MSDPLVSIIAPVYNVETMLCRCLDSVLAQTYANFELILINDGSPDGSGAICDEYAQRDGRFIVIHQPNSGVGTARNKGLSIANGSLISYIDADDYLDPGYLEHLVRAQQMHDADMAVARFHRLSDIDATRDGVSAARGETYIQREDFAPMFADLCEDMRIYTLWAKIYKRSVLEGILYEPNVMLGGDTIMMGEILERVSGIQLTDEADYYYIMRTAGSITSQNNPDLYQGYLYVHEKFCGSIERCGWMTDRVDEVLNRRLSRYATRAIHSIRRGKWKFQEKCGYIDRVLAEPALIEAVRRENELNPKMEFDLILRKDSVALLRFYIRRSRKNRFARRLPWLFSILSKPKRLLGR